MAALEQEIYERNIQTWGYETQHKLNETSVLITGSGIVSQMLCINLAGLGIGRIIIADNGKKGNETEPLAYQSRKGNSRAGMIADRMNEMFPLTYTIPLHTRPNETLLTLEIPDVIVAAGLTGVDILEKISEAYNIPLVYAPVSHSGRSYSSISASIIAGLIADNVFELVSGNKFDNTLKPIKIETSEGVSDIISELESIVSRDYSDLNILIVGAGSLGNFVGMHGALLAMGRMDIMDFDRVEMHNLNRQVLLYNSVGQYKSRVLAKRLMEINPKIRVRGFTERLSRELIPRIPKYDAVFSCVDTSSARLLINRYAIEKNVPLFDGGTSAFSGNTNVFVPGKTPCLDCQLNLRKMAEEERRIQREHGCSVSGPNVIVPNSIIGSLMIGEFVRYISSDNEFHPRRIRYNSNDKRKVYDEQISMKYNKICKCSRLTL